jgi:hypothetical protein
MWLFSLVLEEKRGQNPSKASSYPVRTKCEIGCHSNWTEDKKWARVEVGRGDAEIPAKQCMDIGDQVRDMIVVRDIWRVLWCR